MELCNTNHEKIAYVYGYSRRSGCPLCVANEEIERLKERIEELEDNEE